MEERDIRELEAAVEVDSDSSVADDDGAGTGTALPLSLGGLIAAIIHVLLIVWVFNKFVADGIVKHIEHRRAMMRKLANAQKEYDSIIDDANQQKAGLIEDGVSRKEEIIAEAKLLAGQQRDQIIADANAHGDRIVDEAKVHAARFEETLANDRTDAVKQTTQAVVTKMMGDKQIKQDYIDTIVGEFTSSQPSS